MRKALIAAGLALAAMTATPAGAAPRSLPQADALDRLPADYVRHNREHRLREIEWNMARQRYGRHHGYGYGRRFGPPPYAPAYGYRRHHYDRY